MTKRTNKLTLNRETLRSLSADRLGRVVGGSKENPTVANCGAYTDGCDPKTQNCAGGSGLLCLPIPSKGTPYLC